MLNPAIALLLCASVVGAKKAVLPRPYGVVPSHRQIEHSKLETYAFLHFTVNTFTDREWGFGDEDPNVFNPADFDPDQIVRALKAAGMKGVILTCKHHDGFCLWPTKTTDHSIAHSSWKNGHGDVVRAISDACHRHGLKFGVYLSPWDRNNPQYGTPEYVNIYREQLKELLTNYGPIFEVWHDGANGGDGYYGGARETRSIDPRTYYQWPQTWDLVRELQPDACIFSDVGPDLRWVGNEQGIAPETSWATYDPIGLKGDIAAPGYIKSELSGEGTWGGKHWLPAECDVSIRPGWFWHQAEDSKVKSPAELFDLYCKSVGRGASFLLNVPPNRKGQLSEPDVASLKGFGEIMRRTFAHNLADRAKVKAFTEKKAIDARNLLSSDMSRFFRGDPNEKNSTIEIDFPHDTEFDLIRLREPIQLGQRMQSFSIYGCSDDTESSEWFPVGAGTSIGSCRLLRLDHAIKVKKLRIVIEKSAAQVLLYDLGVFKTARL